MSKNKLDTRCKVLEKIIESISKIYLDKETTEEQKAFVETIIGAAIWYLPQTLKYWTGKISMDAKESLNQNKKARLTKEHQYPRKLAAKELLTKKSSNIPIMQLYETTYAQFNIVTPRENKKISKYQRAGVFIDTASAYKAAGIELLEISAKELSQLRRKT